MVGTLEAGGVDARIKTRGLFEYAAALAPQRQPYISGEGLPPALTAFPQPKAERGRVDSSASIENTLIVRVLRNLAATKPGNELVHWADFGGGYGIAQREYRRGIDPDRQTVTTTNVNLEEHNLKTEFAMLRDVYGPQGDERIAKIEQLLCAAYAPNFVRANMETVMLPTKADLITSVQSIQYADPLRTIANMYRNLASGGIMAVMCEGGLDSTMAYPYRPWKLMVDFTKVLELANVTHAYHGIRGKLGQHRVYIIAKKPDTQMTKLVETIPLRNQTGSPERVARCTLYRRKEDVLPIAITAE